jgi:hypothetical protein
VEFGWRSACQAWALIHLILALPLNLILPRANALQQVEAKAESSEATKRSETFTMIALAYVFAATGFVSAGLSAILPSMLVQFGATPAAALFAGTLVGPSQVAARLVEAGWLGRYHPLISARLATLMTPLGVITIALGGPLAAFYGAGNGILTIARGTLPLALFGPQGFGRRVGFLSLPARATGALAPIAVSLMVEHIGTGALWISALASASAFVVLLLLRSGRTA